MKFCPECGERVNAGAFCSQCGSRYPALVDAVERADRSAGTSGSTHSPANLRQLSHLQDPSNTQEQVAGRPVTHQLSSHFSRPAISDFARDLGAALFLVWALFLHWSDGDQASDAVYVLLPLLCSLASLTVGYVVPILQHAGTLKVSAAALRAVMNVPFAVVVLVAVGRDIAEREGIGVAVCAGLFGAAMAAVPRRADLLAADSRKMAHNWRVGAAALASAGSAAILISFVVQVPPARWFQSGYTFWLMVLPLLIVIALLIGVFALPALRVGRGQVSWQPVAFWLMASLVLMLLFVVGEDAVVVESIGHPMYGLWLLAASGGICAMPLVRGVDGAVESAAFWRLTVAHAFEMIIFTAMGVTLIVLTLMIAVDQGGGSLPGQLIWSLISAVVTGVTALVASISLRGNSVSGDRTGLVAVAIMVLLRIVDLSLTGLASTGDQSIPVSLLLAAGLYGLIVFGLLAPEPMRRDRRHHGGSGPLLMMEGVLPVPDGAPEVPAFAAPIPIEAVTARIYAERAPVADHAPDWSEQTLDPRDVLPLGNLRETGAPAERTKERSAPPAAPRTTTAHDDSELQRRATDPRTPLTELMSLAYQEAGLRPLIAENPATYPGLLEWLAGLGEPAVDAALGRRGR